MFTEKEIRAHIVATALSYLGQKEIPGNKGWYDKEFEERMINVGGWRSGWAWCACFTKLVYKHAYARIDVAFLPYLGKHMQPGVMNTYRALKAEGWRVDMTPEPGALVFWRKYKNGRATGLGHIGIVEKRTDAEIFVSIEGNTNAEGSREGDVVARRGHSMAEAERTHGLKLIGFIHPNKTI